MPVEPIGFSGVSSHAKDNGTKQFGMVTWSIETGST